MKYGVIYSHDFAQFSYGENHPFKLDRGERFYQLLERNQLLSDPEIDLIRPEPAPDQLLLVAHSPAYLKALKEANSGEFKMDMLKFGIGKEDCPVFSGMYQYSRLAVGASFEAAFRVMEGMHNLFSIPWGISSCQAELCRGLLLCEQHCRGSSQPVEKNR
jgi:acetoin utilization protein AcuC